MAVMEVTELFMIETYDQKLDGPTGGDGLVSKPWLGEIYRAGLVNRLGPVVQSVVSLTSSLRVISLTVFADSIYNILIFFAEKMWVAFALQKLLTFFQQKVSAYLRITRFKF